MSGGLGNFWTSLCLRTAKNNQISIMNKPKMTNIHKKSPREMDILFNSVLFVLHF